MKRRGVPCRPLVLWSCTGTLLPHLTTKADTDRQTLRQTRDSGAGRRASPSVDFDRPGHPCVNLAMVGVRSRGAVCVKENLPHRQVGVERATIVGDSVGYRATVLPAHG